MGAPLSLARGLGVLWTALAQAARLEGGQTPRRKHRGSHRAGRARGLAPCRGGQDMTWYDLAGSVGVVLIVAAYLSLQLERVAGTGLPYLLANAVGAALILLSLAFDF